MTVWKIGDRVDVVQVRPLGAAKSAPKARRWALINVECYREISTAARISELGYLAFVPQFKKTERDRTKHRKWREVSRPLFKGYLFAQFSPELDPWGDLERVRGVIGVVRGAGEQIGQVPEAVIEQLRQAESANFGQPEKTEGATVYQSGDRLKVERGPFRDHVVSFVESLAGLDDDGRIVALLDLLGQQVKIKLQASDVARYR